MCQKVSLYHNHHHIDSRKPIHWRNRIGLEIFFGLRSIGCRHVRQRRVVSTCRCDDKIATKSNLSLQGRTLIGLVLMPIVPSAAWEGRCVQARREEQKERNINAEKVLLYS